MRRVSFAIAVVTACLSLSACGKNGAASDTSESASGSAVVTEADLHPCDVTHTSMTDEDCAAAKRWLAEAKTGTAAFAAPARMIQGQTRVVTLAISPESPPPPAVDASASGASAVSDQVAAGSSAAPASEQPPPEAPEALAPKRAEDKGPNAHDVAAETAPGSKVVDYHPLVGRLMQAKLEGEGFDIMPLSAAEQLVSDGSVTTWTWRVTAKEYGNKPLIMKTAVIMKDSRGQTQQLSPFSDTKVVNVIIGVQGVVDWLKDWTNLLKVLAGFLAAVTAVVLAVRTFGKGKS